VAASLSVAPTLARGCGSNNSPGDYGKPRSRSCRTDARETCEGQFVANLRPAGTLNQGPVREV
jgi:hypothetical protein